MIIKLAAASRADVTTRRLNRRGETKQDGEERRPETDPSNDAALFDAKCRFREVDFGRMERGSAANDGEGNVRNVDRSPHRTLRPPRAPSPPPTHLPRQPSPLS